VLIYTHLEDVEKVY